MMDLFQFNWLYWIFGGDANLGWAWKSVRAQENIATNTIVLSERPQLIGLEVGNIDLAGGSDDRTVFNKSGIFHVNLRGVDHVEAALDKDVVAIIHSKNGFTTNGSIDWLHLDVGWHNLDYTYAYRDSFVQTGVGQDKICYEGDYKWAFVRRDDGQLDAYNLHSGFRVRMADWQSLINWGGVEEICTTNRDNVPVTFFPPINSGTDGDRLNFNTIDLSATGTATPTPDYTDRFNSASFKSINYATTNVHKGTAVIEAFVSDTVGGVQSTSKDHITTNGLHHLILEQQAAALDGHLRLYVRNNESGMYNRFNEVFLGASGSDVNANDYSTTSRNAYATIDPATGSGATKVLGTAMYGFDGNDSLTGGAEVDYLFGGTSTYTTKNPGGGIQGNELTGGDGADYFGVGDITDGQDGDAIMTTIFAGRLNANAPTSGSTYGLLSRRDASDAADLATRVATDRINDWTAGVDHMRVLANGTAIIEGLGTANGLGGAYVIDPISGDAERIDLSGSRVNNEGKIVARGLGGRDTLIGSTGDDWLYGNASSNYYTLGGVGNGNDRVYVDQFEGSRSKHFVTGFTNTAGAADDRDLVMLNKRIIDSFFSGGANRGDLKQDITSGTYSAGKTYSAGSNYLHDVFYNPSYSSTNTQHSSDDGAAFWQGTTGADGKSSLSGLGMAIAGRAMFAIPFVGPIIGAAMVGASVPIFGLGFKPSETQPHQNATFSGFVGNYLNVISDTKIANPVTSTIGVDDTGKRFLDFFPGSTTNDGYLPVVEFTAHSGQGIYGFFALHSNVETFVYLVASSDNMVENREAILVAEINGLLTAADFGIYDGLDDVYNYGVLPDVVIRTPTISAIKDSASPTADSGLDGIIADAKNPIIIEGTVSGTGSLFAGSYFRVLDGSKVIHDGNVTGLINIATVLGENIVTITSANHGLTGDGAAGSARISFAQNIIANGITLEAGTQYTVTVVDRDKFLITDNNTATVTGTVSNVTATYSVNADWMSSGTSFIFTDNRPLGTTVRNTDPTSDIDDPNTFVLSDARVLYTVEFVDGETGIPTRVSKPVIEIGGGNGIINGGDGIDTLLLTKTSPYLNSFANNLVASGIIPAADDRLVGMEKILLAPEPIMASSITVVSGEITGITFDASLLSTAADGTYDIIIENVQTTNETTGASSTVGSGASAQVTITTVSGVKSYTVSITNGGSGYAATNTDTKISLSASFNTGGIDLILTGQTENIEVYGSTAADSVVGGSGNDQLFGVGGNDTLIGGDGDDTIDGGAGADSVDGGIGNDVLIYASQAALIEDVTVIGGGGTDTIRMDSTTSALTLVSSDFAKVTQVEILALNGTGAQNVTLGAATNTAFATGITITTLANATSLNLQGALSTVTVHATGTDNADTLIGGSANDTLLGGNGADTIIGGAGSDSLIGGAGSDTFVYANAAHVANDTVDGGAGDTDMIRLDAAGTYNFTTATVSNIEQVAVNANAAMTITLSDDFNGDNANVEIVNTTGNAVTQDLTINASAFTGGTGAINVSATNFDGNDSIVGGVGNDTINGGAGNDTIIGGAGSDSLIGGTGSDTFVYSNVAHLLGDTINGGVGDVDVIRLDVGGTYSFNLASVTNVEKVALNNDEVFALVFAQNSTSQSTDPTNDSGVLEIVNVTGAEITQRGTIFAGFSQNMALYVSATDLNGGNEVVGGAGNDTVYGGTGNDNIIVLGGNDVVYAGDGDDTIYGGLGNDFLDGGAGNDTFVIVANSHLTNDTIDGGAGDTDVIRLDAADTYNFTTATVSNIEQVAVNANAAMTITLSDNFNGDNANVEIVNTTGNAVTADLTINASAFTGGTGAINVSATDFNGNDSIVGGVGNDTINGGAGNDTIIGGVGNDSLLGGNGSDVIWGGAGIDTMSGLEASGTAVDKLIVVGDLSGSTDAKLSLINTTLNSFLGYNPGLTASYTSDVASGGTLVFDSSGSDELHAFGNVDLSNVDITGTAVVFSYSTLKLTSAQLNQLKQINLVGSHNHEIIITDASRNVLDADTQLNFLDDWLEQTGQQLAFLNETRAAENGNNRAAKLRVGGTAGQDLEFEVGGTRNTDEQLKAIAPLNVPAGSPIGSRPGVNAAFYSEAGTSDFAHDFTPRSGTTRVSKQANVNDRFNGLSFVSNFEVGPHIDHNGRVPVPNTFTGIGDNSVHNSQFEVFYGNYDIRSGVFTVSKTTPFPGTTGDRNPSLQDKYTLILFDNDITNNVLAVDGAIFANHMFEPDWQLLNGGRVDATLGHSGTPISGASFQTQLGNNGDNTLTGVAGKVNYLYGHGGNDVINGNSLDDFIIAGVGSDTVYGGGGNDVIDLGKSAWATVGDQLTDVVIFNAVAGTSTDSGLVGSYNITSLGDILKTGQDFVFNFEVSLDIVRIAATNVGNFNHANNTSIAGNDYQANTLLVDVNADNVIGTGDVVVTFRELGSGVNMNTNRVQYDITATNAGNTIVGGLLGDTIRGGSGNDTIEGGAGSDSLFGGNGNDTFRFGDGEFVAAESVDGGDGTDTILFTANSQTVSDAAFANKSNLEALTLASGTNSVTLSTSAASAFSSGVAVTVTGGGGADTINASAFGRAVSISGGEGADSLAGGAGNDTIIGDAGNDTISGGAGADRMEGGTGDDTYVFTASADTSDSIIESVNGGIDTLYINGASVDMSALVINSGSPGGPLNGAGDVQEGIEIVIINAGETATFAATQLAGTSVTINESANTSNTTLNITGATGTQSFANLAFTQAGAGNAFDDGGDRVVINIAGSGTNDITGTEIGDVFIAGAQSGTLSINGGNGTDEFRATADLTLSGWTSVENLSLLGDGTDVTIASSLLAGAGLQSVTGTSTGASIEYLKIIGSNAGETINLSSITFTDAAASISGGSGNDSLVGGSGNDYISAGLGNNTLVGGAGIDTLVGGDGADRFVFSSPSVTSTINDIALMDVIVGFDSSLDSLDLGTSASTITITPISAGAGGDGDDYVLSWDNGSQMQYVRLSNTGTSQLATSTQTYTSGTGILTLAVTSGPGFDEFIVTDTGITVSGDGPFRAYLHADGLAPERDTPATYYTKSGNYGASNSHSFDFTVIKTGAPSSNESIGTAFSHPILGARMTIQSTSNPNTNTTHPAYLYIGDNASGAVPDTLIAAPGQNSIMYGFDGDDVITGNTGNDTIFGGLGDDTITGGVGADRLTGGEGADIFVTLLADAGDTITDFTTAVDKFDFNTALLSIDGAQTAPTVFQSAAAGTTIAANTTVFELEGITTSGTAANLAAALGLTATNSDIDIGDKLLFVNYLTGGGAQVWYFEDANGADIDSVELTLISTLSGVSANVLVSGDFI